MAFTGTPLRLPPSLGDGVIVLDGHTLADAQAHWEGEDAEMMRRFDSPRKATVEEIRGAIQRWIDARAAGGPNFAYALRDASGTLMGGCETFLLSADSANISYWTYPQYRGRGYAPRAAALLCTAAESIPGLRRIEAHVDPDNVASQRVAGKLGFVEIGTVEDEAWNGTRSIRIRYVRPVPKPQ
ncbi:MAG TPA: GNAT family protein [Rhizomicrobium sp.]|jgi:RimJ/RimL family protein N-acetyltransferase